MPINIGEVVEDFMRGRFAKRRNELVHIFTHALATDARLQRFSLEVCEESIKANQSPTIAMRQSMMYGLVLGVLMAEDEFQRKVSRV